MNTLVGIVRQIASVFIAPAERSVTHNMRSLINENFSFFKRTTPAGKSVGPTRKVGYLTGSEGDAGHSLVNLYQENFLVNSSTLLPKLAARVFRIYTPRK